MTSRPSRPFLEWARQESLELRLAFVGVLVLVCAYLAIGDDSFGRRGEALMREVMGGILVVLVLFLSGSFLLFRRGFSNVAELGTEIAHRIQLSRAEGIEAVYVGIEEVDWKDLFVTSSSVEIVGGFFTAPLRAANVRDFLRRGGRMTIVTYHPQAWSAFEVSDLRRNPRRREFGTNSRKRLAESLEILALDLEEVPDADRSAIEVLTTSDPLPYAAYCFDRRHLVMSPHERFFALEKRCPRIKVDLRASDGYRAFWEHEMEGYAEAAGKPMTVDQVLRSFSETQSPSAPPPRS